ncbi:MAG TPA: CpsB/CapC family capsule biosynthesis tyrosine phosphatase, partial [Gemmatimonadales bacterium]|nr:CpsB/CapC family capsule biosynthesis tyrosine phosphatase [Gemmatimonadales bacterium]
MIDLHTHLIPGVDDGSETAARSVEVLERFAAQGVTAVCCTPHLKASEAAAAPGAELEALLAGLRAAAPASVALSRGYEIMLDVPAPELAGRGLTLAGTRYVLVEFGRLVPADASVEALRRLTDQGLVPVLAHPERYHACSVEQARRWRQAGAVLQLDATTLLASTRRAERARALLEAGLGDLIASDNHGDGRSLAVAVEWLDAHGGERQARALA